MLTPDVWDSAAFSSIFLASGFSCSQAESTPAHTQVTQTVSPSVQVKVSIQTRRNKMSDSNQWQCPNCGGYKTSSIANYVTEETPFPMETRVKVGVIGLIPLSISIAIYFFFDKHHYWFNDMNGGSAILFFPACFGVIALLLALFQSAKKTKVIDSYRFNCSLCGYSWNWRQGQPVPKVKANPDLIAKGTQKLEQEEEQRQKDAAALYYLTHKK